MLGTIVNVILVILGGSLGLVLKNRFSPRMGRAVMAALGLCTLGIGLSSLLATEDFLCVILCMALGSLLGEWIDIEKHMDLWGEALRKRLGGRDNSRFVEGFVSASVLYCVGAMAINGSIQAGLNGDHSILIAKGVMDGMTAITFASTMGIGVLFSTIPILIYQGGMTLLAGVVGPCLSPAVITEMSAVGGAIIAGIAFNLLGLGKEKLRVGNMLPAIFLPLLYLPLSAWLGGLLG